MGRNKLGGNVHLLVELDETGAYSPGNTTTGRAICKSHVISPKAWLTVQFAGTSNVEIRTDDGDGGIRHYKSTIEFIAEPVIQTLFNGPIHVPPNPTTEQQKSWPFSLTVPHRRHPDRASRQPTTTASSKQSQSEYAEPPPYSSSSSSSSHNTSSTLPASFSTVTTDIWSITTRASISYHLTARLHEQHGTRTQTTSTILPIIIILLPLLPSDAPLQPTHLHTQTSKHTIYSQRLLGRDNLSLWDRFSKTIHAPGVPWHEFEVAVSCPAELQPGNGPFSFQVGIMPLRQSESLGSLEKAGHDVKLQRLVLKLGARTDVTCPDMGLVGFKTVEERGVVNVVWEMAEGVRLPCRPEAWDVGRKMGLKFKGSEAVYCDETSREGVREVKLPYLSQLCGDFMTANLRHRHEMEWEIKLAVAGETVNVKGSRGVVILGSST